MSCQTPTPATQTVLQQPTPSEIVNLTSSLSFSSPLKRTLSSRIDNLVEIATLPEDAQVGKSLLTLLSPYNIYRCSSSLIRSIRSLISSKSYISKEYVQASRINVLFRALLLNNMLP